MLVATFNKPLAPIFIVDACIPPFPVINPDAVIVFTLTVVIAAVPVTVNIFVVPFHVNSGSSVIAEEPFPINNRPAVIVFAPVPPRCTANVPFLTL